MSKNFAHRGFSGKYPENTMLAFKKAIEIGVDGIELDVQLTKDNVVVIIHDETIDRTTNGKGEVVNYAYKELEKFDASYIYTGQYGINKIPTLDEYLKYVKDLDIVTNIELKNSINEYEGLEELVLELIRKYNLEKKVIISSFNHYSVVKMKKLAPELKCGFLCEDTILNPGKYCKENGVECFHPRYKVLSLERIEELRKNGIEINTWTVNKKEDIKDLIDKEIDIIIGNYPDLTKEFLEITRRKL